MSLVALVGDATRRPLRRRTDARIGTPTFLALADRGDSALERNNAQAEMVSSFGDHNDGGEDGDEDERGSGG